MTPALGEALSQAMETYDPSRVSTVPSGALAAADARAGTDSLAQMMDRMKMQARTTSGASGRPEPISGDAATWEAIKNAGVRSYSDVRR